MPTINCFLSDQLTPEASALRAQFYGFSSNQSIADKYDATANHLLLEIDGQLVGYARLSSGPNGFFESLVDAPVPFPIGPYVADGSRVTVSPTWRGIDLSSLLLIELLLWTNALGYRYLVGSVKTGRRTLELVHGLGFVNCGEPVVQYWDRINVPSPFTEDVLFQCVAAETKPLLPSLIQKHTELVSQLAEQGFAIITNCPVPNLNQA